MCKRRDSIEAMSSAADKLAEACEAEMRGAPVDAPAPTRRGVARALRATFREMTTTPTDMAVQLRKLR